MMSLYHSFRGIASIAVCCVLIYFITFVYLRRCSPVPSGVIGEQKSLDARSSPNHAADSLE